MNSKPNASGNPKTKNLADRPINDKFRMTAKDANWVGPGHQNTCAEILLPPTPTPNSEWKLKAEKCSTFRPPNRSPLHSMGVDDSLECMRNACKQHAKRGPWHSIFMQNQRSRKSKKPENWPPRLKSAWTAYFCTFRRMLNHAQCMLCHTPKITAAQNMHGQMGTLQPKNRQNRPIRWQAVPILSTRSPKICGKHPILYNPSNPKPYNIKRLKKMNEKNHDQQAVYWQNVVVNWKSKKHLHAPPLLKTK